MWPMLVVLVGSGSGKCRDEINGFPQVYHNLKPNFLATTLSCAELLCPRNALRHWGFTVLPIQEPFQGPPAPFFPPRLSCSLPDISPHSFTLVSNR
jgi:hypothetical protein